MHAILQHVEAWGMPDVTAFVQCTAPLMTADDVRDCVRCHNGTGIDLTVQVVESHAIFADEVGSVSPRRQERQPRFEIAGTIWALNTRTFLERGTVYGGSTQYHITQTPKLDIDTEADLRLAEMLLASRQKADVPAPGWYEYVGIE